MFFNKKIHEKIIENESPTVVKENFLSKKECKYFLNLFRKMPHKSIGKNKFVDREESTKIFFDFNMNKKTKSLKKKIQDELGDFFLNDVSAHLTTSRYPLRLHVDTGNNRKEIIDKNVLIPLEILYDKTKKKHKPPNSIIFENKWYGQSAIFTKLKDKNTDFIIKDRNNKFVDIVDIQDFYKNIQNLDEINFTYHKKLFFINKMFKEYILRLCKMKRFNVRTDKHIINKVKFNKKDYNKYLSHQPYEDCTGLKINKVIPSKVGSLIYWDRTRIHSSDNFLKNNVTSKTFIAFFTSKNKI
jgi:hypothetical protein|tara:strand:+ start:222 stop:1118 length:897 start_codon:yes stop_codon:yes gene_type:complete